MRGIICSAAGVRPWSEGKKGEEKRRRRRQITPPFADQTTFMEGAPSPSVTALTAKRPWTPCALTVARTKDHIVSCTYPEQRSEPNKSQPPCMSM